MPRETLTLRNRISPARQKLWRVGDPTGLGRLTEPADTSDWVHMGKGVMRNQRTGEEITSPAYQRMVEAEREHQLDMANRRLEASQAAEQRQAERKSAGQRATLDTTEQTLAELEALKKSGGNVGNELSDALGGLLKDMGDEQPARWLERMTYDEAEETMRAKLVSAFVQTFNAMQKGTPSDRDLQIMRQLDPSAPGLSMMQRINNLKMARDHARTVLERGGALGAAMQGQAAAPQPAATPSAGVLPPGLPTDVTPEEWEAAQKWAREQGL